MDKYNHILKRFFFVAVSIYAILVAIYILKIPAGRGDEALFVSDLNLIHNKGWIDAITKNISIPFMILVYPLSFILKKHIALRLISLFLTIALFFYFEKRYKFSTTFYFYLVFYLSTTIFFFYGTNDTLFNVSLIVFFSEVFLLYQYKKFDSSIAFVALIIAFFTRALLIVYLPVVLIGLFIIYKCRKSFTLKLRYPIAVLIIMLVINIPSLKENGVLSYDLKSPPKSIDATWGQRQYLAQLLINKGELKKGSHPTWAETQEYINVNGVESLPISISDAIFFDLKLTFKEFFKDFGNTLFLGFRQLGLILALIIIIPLARLLKQRKLEYNYFLPASFLIMIAAFSFIIISNVELRWLAPIFVMAIVWYTYQEKTKLLNNKIVFLNYIVLLALVSYGGFRMFEKLMF